MRYQSNSLRRIFSSRIFAAVLLAGATSTAAFADADPQYVPAGTRLKFHLTAPIASNKSKTGEAFYFTLLTPIVLEGSSIPTEGTTGSGTVYLAGHAGSSGHEGDLTLRLDSLRTANGQLVMFADQRFRINGRNRKLIGALLGAIPYAGMGARFIRGSDVRVDPATPIETVLDRPATITVEDSAASIPSPSAN